MLHNRPQQCRNLSITLILANGFLNSVNLAGAADYERNSAPRYPAVIDCSTSSDALHFDGLPPGVKSYSMDEALEKRDICAKGDLQACYELCRRRLNGNRPGYPPWTAGSDYIGAPGPPIGPSAGSIAFSQGPDGCPREYPFRG